MASNLSMSEQNKIKTPNQINDVLSAFVLDENNDDREQEDGRSIESDESPKPEINLIK